MLSPIKNYCVFDIETTGLSAEKHAIIEIACCAFDNDLNDLKEYESGVMRIYDNREIQEEALKANGITRDQIENGRDPKQVAEELCSFFTSLKSKNNKVVLVGQNSDKFDIPFLDNYLAVFKKDLSSLANTDFTIDTMWWARVKYPELVNYKLGTLCEANNIELINAHRAINDTRATKNLVKHFISSLRSGANQESQTTRYRAVFEF
jgi:DNA polymerase-3 subunit alpha (Gram-positive type)